MDVLLHILLQKTSPNVTIHKQKKPHTTIYTFCQFTSFISLHGHTYISITHNMKSDTHIHIKIASHHIQKSIIHPFILL